MTSSARLVILVFFGFFAISTTIAEIPEKNYGPQSPSYLRCEYLKDPVAIDVEKPRFSWILNHTYRGQKQTAYRILVSTSPDLENADMWDSEKVFSDQSVHVEYNGEPLKSSTTYFWKVCYWDNEDRLSGFSSVNFFETGLLLEKDWEGEWIGGFNQLRKEFTLDKTVIRARAYICGLGYYELRLNGQKIGKNVLDPGWTVMNVRALYSTYDITDYLLNGENAIGVMLGKGWFGSRSLILQLLIEVDGGETISVVSDQTWKGQEGPIITDSIFNGEIYDARLEASGWDSPGFDESDWRSASLAIAPKGKLSAQMMQPIQVMDTIVPLKMTNPESGMYVFDMGQNFSGWVRLKVKGPRGTAVHIKHSELLYENGKINTENLRSARAEDVYTLSGDGEEIYEPHFTYHGFRFVELTGFPGVPTLDSIRGRVVHSAVAQTGNFSSSKEILNQIQRLILWGQKTNLHSIPTDCSQRDERMGWLGDAHLTAEQAIFNFDIAAFYTNFIRDMQDVQDKKGTLTDTVPHVWGQRPADPAWGTAYPLMVWYMYIYYGDKRILEEHYDSLKKYVDFLRSRAEDGLVKFSHYGDWVSIEKTPGDIVSSFYYYYDVKILSDMAEALSRNADVKSYKKLCADIKKKFHGEYYDSETGNYANGTQTANLLPLFLDLVPESEKGKVYQNLNWDILYKNNTHLTTGIIGTKYLMEVLTDFNNSFLAYDLAVQTTYPSWGYMIKNGATTLWELWQNKTGPSMNSHNHPMFGSIGAWFYKTLVGINLAEGSVGFEKIRIQPHVIRDLEYAAGSIQTIRGPVECSWIRLDKSLSLDVTIPVNSEAEIIMPKLNLKDISVMENSLLLFSEGRFKTGLAGIIMVDETKTSINIKLGSGRYSFKLIGK